LAPHDDRSNVSGLGHGLYNTRRPGIRQYRQGTAGRRRANREYAETATPSSQGTQGQRSNQTIG
jgi:hypothetical protein